jgi:hypothetical protein
MTNVNETNVRELIEEQLGEFRRFAGLPATEIEAMAHRITRAIADYLAEGKVERDEEQRSAA